MRRERCSPSAPSGWLFGVPRNGPASWSAAGDAELGQISVHAALLGPLDSAVAGTVSATAMC
jgi:hypothetical protein